MDQSQVDQVAAAMRLAVASFAVTVAVEEAPGLGGWAAEVRPPGRGMASVEVLIPTGAGDECLISAGSGSAHHYTGGDVPWIVADALPVIRAAAYGDLQTAGETLYLLGNRGWSTRGGISLLPRFMRVRSRYEPYPAAHPLPVMRDLVRLVAEQMVARFAVQSEEITDDGGWAIHLRPLDRSGPEAVVHAGQDRDESWSIVTIVGDESGAEGSGGITPDPAQSQWDIHDWGNAGDVAAELLATLTQIASGDVQLALDGIGTVWFRHGGRWRSVGPQRRRARRRRPHVTLAAWSPRSS